MSENQFIYFAAFDRPLNDRQLKFMEKQSTCALITRREFRIEYHYGDFRGNPRTMLRNGFDVHYHFANFGIRKLMFRLPKLPCPPSVFSKFKLLHSIVWKKDPRGKAGVLTIDPYAEPDTYDYLVDVELVVPYLKTLRTMLIDGDLRPLYLAWLACNEEPERREPPVPAGLQELGIALDTLAEFYEIPDSLIAAAAERSPKSPPKQEIETLTRKWLKTQRKPELLEIVESVILEDVEQVKSDLLLKIRNQFPSDPWPFAKPTRTFGELEQAGEESET